MRSPVVALAGLTLLALGLIAPTSAMAAPIPTLYGGTGATGNPGVVQLAIWDGTQWGSCSAAMWKPRLLLTAGHCVTKKGGAGFVDQVHVFAPGVAAPIYSNVGPVGATSVPVKQYWIPPDYAHLDDSVRPNDFAVIELASDLAPPAYTRLATQWDIAKWASQQAVVEHVGYGLLGPGQFTDVPMTISAPVTGYYPASPLGAVFTTFADQTKGACPGDSGSPVFRHDDDGAYVLVGTVAGGISPCIPGFTGEPHTSNFIGMAYLSLLNPALVDAGYAAIPSAPGNIGLQATNRDVTVTWDAPQSAADAVATYQVLNEAGAVVCTSTSLTCTVPNLPDGTHAFTVRAVNADGDGDVLPVMPGAGVGVSAPERVGTPTAKLVKRNRARVTFDNPAGQTSAVITGFTVTDAKGRTVCRVTPTKPAILQADRLHCDSKPLKPGKYRFFVVANTQMGDTPKSKSSASITVRG